MEHVGAANPQPGHKDFLSHTYGMDKMLRGT